MVMNKIINITNNLRSNKKYEDIKIYYREVK
jgi:hypothetical protein